MKTEKNEKLKVWGECDNCGNEYFNTKQESDGGFELWCKNCSLKCMASDCECICHNEKLKVWTGMEIVAFQYEKELQNKKFIVLDDLKKMIDEFENNPCKFCGTPKYCVDGETECINWKNLKSKLGLEK